MKHLFKTIIGSIFLLTGSSAALAEGKCGLPPKIEDPAFCECFLDESVAACKSSGQIPEALCSPHAILLQIKNNSDSNFKKTCKNYKTMRPEGVGDQECVDDMVYVKHYC